MAVDLNSKCDQLTRIEVDPIDGGADVVEEGFVGHYNLSRSYTGLIGGAGNWGDFCDGVFEKVNVDFLVGCFWVREWKFYGISSRKRKWRFCCGIRLANRRFFCCDKLLSYRSLKKNFSKINKSRNFG